jgi:hypothetical protein
VAFQRHLSLKTNETNIDIPLMPGIRIMYPSVAAVNNITYRFAGQYCTVYIPVQGEIAKIIPVSYGLLYKYAVMVLLIYRYTLKVVSSNPAHGEVSSIHQYVIKFISDL